MLPVAFVDFNLKQDFESTAVVEPKSLRGSLRPSAAEGESWLGEAGLLCIVQQRTTRYAGP